MSVSTDFLAELFAQSHEATFVCSLANDRAATRRLPPREIKTRNPRLIDHFARTCDRPGRGVFFCVATLGDGARRNKQNLAELVCLHADIDFKGVVEPRTKVEAALKHLPLQPNLVVFSGHGLHSLSALHDPAPARRYRAHRTGAASPRRPCCRRSGSLRSLQGDAIARYA